MKTIKYLFLSTIIQVFIITSSLAQVSEQIGIGEWKSHLPYRFTTKLAKVENSIYVAGENGIYVFDINSKQINRLSKNDGLHSLEVKTLDYDPVSKTLVISYNDGIIDLIRSGEVQSIQALNRAQVNGVKLVNAVTFYQNKAYLSTEIGLILLDLKTGNILESYLNIDNGVIKPVKACAIVDHNVGSDSIFVIIEGAIFVAKIDPKINLIDNKNWFKFGSNEGIGSGYKYLTEYDKSIYASNGNNQILIYKNKKWQNAQIPLDKDVQLLKGGKNSIGINLKDKLIVYNNATKEVNMISNELLSEIRDFKIDDNGKVWIADFGKGLVTDFYGDFQSFSPLGMENKDLYRLRYYDGKIAMVTGGYAGYYASFNKRNGFEEYDENGIWTAYNYKNNKYPDVPNTLSIDYNPVSKKYYASTYYLGIIEWDKSDFSYNWYRDGSYSPGTGLLSELWQTEPFNWIRVTDIKVDKNGLVWCLQGLSDAFISTFVSYDPINKKWNRYGGVLEEGGFSHEFEIDKFGNKWATTISEKKQGIISFNETKNPQFVSVNEIEGQGSLPTKEVNCLVIDLKQQVWIGTNKGVAIITDPNQVFKGPFTTIKPIFEGRPLFVDDIVLSIEVDGANRKWMAIKKKGVYLINEDGTKIIHYFNESNSGLLSDFVFDIELNEKTGEVFFLTDKGISSYKGDAIGDLNPTNDKSLVRVLPNPVKPDYDNIIAIDGIVFNSVVKITDSTGELVYQTRAAGGRASWNLKLTNGGRAKAGIYLVFSVDDEGTTTLVSKFAIL